ncbi:hypothetical protein ACWIGI_02200 [Nocardia sp. NPDC055321]
MTTYSAVSAPGYTPPSHSRAWRLSMAAITAFIGAVCLWVLWEYASHGDRLVALLLGGWVLVVAGGIWLVAAVSGAVAHRAWILTAAAPVAVTVTLALLSSGAPTRIGWELSRPALERTAGACADTHAEQRFGMYRVDYVRVIAGGCAFSLADTSLGVEGFAYIPHGDPPAPAAHARAGTSYTRIDGPWYTYESWISAGA